MPNGKVFKGMYAAAWKFTGNPGAGEVSNEKLPRRQ